MSQKYPIGIETFADIIEGGYAYADKTEVIYRLTQAGKYFFLSRPRRFGKSLMLSTMEAYFDGRKELFEGLWLGSEQGVDWAPRPVLRLNFVDTKPTVEGLNSSLEFHLRKWETIYGLTNDNLEYGNRFRDIIETAYQTTGRKVVILVDEYDKVLVNTWQDHELHEAVKSILKPVFGVLKGADRFIEFAMLTGVSRFSKLSIFSDLNNLNDISLDKRFSTICGITEDELRRYFADGIEIFAQERGVDFDGMINILKQNYDGYHFSKTSPDIYNPFSLINALSAKEILHRWFETGTPTFLLEKIFSSEEDIRQLLSPVASGFSLATLAINDNDLTGMLYQTGYLTIKGYDEEEDIYLLGIPNKEVETGIYRSLLPLYTGKDMTINDSDLYKLRKAIRAGEPEKFLSLLKSFLAGIPQHLSEKKHEIYYENNIYLILRLIGFDIVTEQATSDGRIDAVLKTPRYIYVMELKLNGTPEEAMRQIRKKNYALPFEISGRKIILIGVNFSKETRTLDRWIIE